MGCCLSSHLHVIVFFLKEVTEIFSHVPLPHGLQGPVSLWFAFCPRSATWTWRGSRSTPRRTDLCARSMHMPSTCREPRASDADRRGTAPATGNKGFKEADVSFEGKGGSQEATEPFWSIILALSSAHRLCICIVQTRSQMKIPKPS